MKNRRGRTARRRTKSIRDFTPCTDDRDIDLLKWLKKRFSFRSNSLTAADFDGIGRGVLTKRAINLGDTILSVPANALMGVDRACTDSWLIRSILLVHCSGKVCPIDGVQALCVLLIEERRKAQFAAARCTKSRGKWEPYINVLPLSFAHTLYWEEGTRLLLPQEVYEKAICVKEEVESQQQHLNELITLVGHQGILREFCGNDLCKHLVQEIAMEEYIWAWCCVNTRCVYSDCDLPMLDGIRSSKADRYFLIPFLDLFNHSNTVKVEARYDKVNEKFELISESRVGKYCQVFIHYGTHSNNFLFEEYGFIINDDENANDVVPLNWSYIAGFYSLKNETESTIMSAMKRYSIKRDWCFTYNGPSWSLIITIFLLEAWNTNANVDLVEELSSLLGLKPSNETTRLQISRKTEKMLVNMCQRKVEHSKLKILECQEIDQKDCSNEDKKHIELVVNLWKIYLSVLEASMEFMKRNDFLLDFM